MKLLLAVDSSAASNAMIDDIESRPWPPGTEITVLTVIDLFAMTATIGYLEPFVKTANDAAQTMVEQIAQRLVGAGFNATARAIEGYPGTSIVEEAERIGCDFVMVGSHGHSGFVRFLIGSIAKAVVQNAPCSVSLVRQTNRKREKGSPLRLLIGTDGSDYSAAAIRSVIDRPWPENSRLRIISVVENIVPAAEPWYVTGAIAERVREENRKNAEEAVEAAKHMLVSANLEAETAVLNGTPKKKIVDEAHEWNADLLVVGSHGRRGVRRYLLGSVSEAAALHAHCSVEVIRDRALLGETQ